MFVCSTAHNVWLLVCTAQRLNKSIPCHWILNCGGFWFWHIKLRYNNVMFIVFRIVHRTIIIIILIIKSLVYYYISHFIYFAPPSHILHQVHSSRPLHTALFHSMKYECISNWKTSLLIFEQFNGKCVPESGRLCLRGQSTLQSNTRQILQKQCIVKSGRSKM